MERPPRSQRSSPGPGRLCPAQRQGFGLIALRARATRLRASFAVAAALLVVVLLVAPGGALASSIRLLNPTVSPRSGTTATTFSFAVTYRNKQGTGAPNEVSVVIDGVSHRMVAGSGTDWKNGVAFTFAMRLPTGTHSIAFHSLGRDRFVDDLAAGTVTVAAAPAPGTTPTPPPAANSPPPTTAPTGSPSAPASGGTSGSTGGGTGDSGTDRDYDSIGGSTSGGSGSGGSGDEVYGSRGGPGLLGTPGSGDGASGAIGAGGAIGGGMRSGDDTASADHGGSGRGGGGWGDLGLYLKALSWGGSGTRSMPLLPSIIIAAGTMAMLMTFLFFGKRRRDGEPPQPDDVLSAAAARGTGQAASATLVPNFPVVPGIPEDEIGLPRWRRPSLLVARKTDPARDGIAVAAPLTFARGAVGLVGGAERRYIRYHVVGLLDVPDEFRGTEIGILSRDDEVQLLERSGTYWRVLCPDGQEGWIHKMTLGDAVGEASAPADARPEYGGIDDDVLTAFMTARGRA
jgi:hypothetical protein